MSSYLHKGVIILSHEDARVRASNTQLSGGRMKIKGVGRVGLFIFFCGVLATPLESAGQSLRLTGSGASFPFPLYGQWFKDYSKAHDGVTIDYQAKGSGAGIRD